MEQKNIMDTSFKEERIISLADKKYAFKNLNEDFLVYDYEISMFKSTNSFNFSHFNKKILDALNCYSDLYCFIYFPYWQLMNRMVKYLRLQKYLIKKESKTFNFIIESEKVKDDYVMYYGIIKVNKNNFSDILNILSLWNTGLLFSWDEFNLPLNILCDKLVDLLESNNESVSEEKAKIMNKVTSLDKNSIIINPYTWPEFDNYHLDVFFTKDS